MSIRFYDEALATKLSKWVKDPNLRVLKPDESSRLFEMTLDQTKDEPLKLPLISISRGNQIEILNTKKQSRTFNGFCAEKNQHTTTILNVIPIQIPYQIDIYTKGMEEADEYVRNFVFNFINYPALLVNLPYNDLNIEHKSNITLDAAITDNSNVKEHLFADQFVRFTLSLVIEDAYLFSAPIKENAQLVGMDLEVQNRITSEIDETVNIF